MCIRDRGQVASQTLRNLVAVDAASRMVVFRPLIGTDKMDIMATARKIGTYDISSEPFHDCCPVFLPRMPALYASAADLDEAEAGLDIPGPVSYTHLDVYKRQSFTRGVPFDFSSPMDNSATVGDSTITLCEASTRPLRAHEVIAATRMDADTIRRHRRIT